MTDTFFCPRAVENGGGPDSPFMRPFNGETSWRQPDNRCGYCGSLHQDDFMARLEAGDVTIVPTDKSYKAYIRNDGGTPFKQTYRDCGASSDCKGPDTCTHWVTREIAETKFYFQHLTDDQRRRVVELLNGKKVKFAAPGYFYVLPFFCSRAGA
jgi:hypothetical protein